MELQEKIQNKVIELLEQIGVEAQVGIDTREEDEDKKYIWVELQGEDAARLIGYHGRSMDSLQTVIALIVENELRELEAGLILEINDYRKEREKQIYSIAERAIHEVQQTNQQLELDPMRPFERRIIHLKVQESSGVGSDSIGQGRERRVIIKPNDPFKI